MRRPSVLFINRVYPPARGATGRVLRDLAKSFAREGWHVTVVTTGSESKKERDGAVRLIRVKTSEKPSGLFSYARIWRKLLITALRQPAPTLLVTLSDPPLLVVAGQIFKKAKKCRHIHWCHDVYPDILPALGIRFPYFIQRLFQGFARRALEKTDKVIVIGRCMVRRLVYNGIDPMQITMIPNWPDSELSPHPSNQNSTASEPAPPVQHYTDMAKPFEEQIKGVPKFRVLYAGNIGLAHPIETILGAAEILNQDNPEIEFVFVGDGARFDELARERDRRRLDNIRLLPYQPQTRLRQLMESGDIHLISMDEKAAGMLVPCKFYSALAVSRPCVFVGPAASEAAKVINDFKAGTVVPQGNPEDLAARIKHYRLNDAEWFSAYNGAAQAAKVFLPEDSINAWIERAWGVVQDDIKVA